MKQIRVLIAIICAVVCIPSYAQTGHESLPADVRVVIDISGSMKQNDPQNLRQPALELLVQLLPEGSKAGVWTFGQYINMLVPHKPVTPEWRAKAKAKASEISSLGLYTNIGGALGKASYDSDSPSDKYRTSVILLTDGMVDIDKSPEKNQAEWRRIVDKVLPDLQRANYTLHTIALSDNADDELLNKLALGTDGIAAVAKSADDLMKIFLQAFDQAVPAEQVPLDGDRFVIDSSVEEFTALIFRRPNAEPTRLISPDKTRYSFSAERSDVNWYRTDQYDLVTIKQPLEGEWRLQAHMMPDSRVTVVSNLNLLVKPLPSNLFVGEGAKLSLLLQEDGKTLSRAEFLRLISVDASSQFEDDSGPVGEVWSDDLSGSLPPGNGIYTASLDFFSSPGDYQLKVVVDGKSFQRQYAHKFSVREPFGVSLDKQVVSGNTQYLLTVSAYGDDVDLQKTKIVAKVKDPKGRTSLKPLQLTPQDNWQLRISPDKEGLYRLALRVNGVDKKGKKFGVDPQPVSFQYPDGDDPFAEPKAAEPVKDVAPPQPEIEKRPEPEKEPEPEPEPEPEVVEPEPAIEPEAESEEEEPQWLLYALLAGGNLIILVLAFFAYRMIMGGKKDDSLEALEKSIEEAEQADTEPSVEAAAAEEPDPAMDDVAGSDEAAADEDPLAAVDMADDLLGDDLDISNDSALDADLDLTADEPSPTEEASEPEAVEAEEPALDEDDDLGFSMDDFSDLGSDDDEDDK